MGVNGHSGVEGNEAAGTGQDGQKDRVGGSVDIKVRNRDTSWSKQFVPSRRT